jgi:hypothetical protein
MFACLLQLSAYTALRPLFVLRAQSTKFSLFHDGYSVELLIGSCRGWKMIVRKLPRRSLRCV